MPSNFPWLRIKGMKIDSKKKQQKKCPDSYETVLRFGKRPRKEDVPFKTDVCRLGQATVALIWKEVETNKRHVGRTIPAAAHGQHTLSRQNVDLP